MADYSKWDKFEVSSSDEDEQVPLGMAPPDNDRDKALLIAEHFDTMCEKLRWALDRYAISYFEERHPFGFHLFATLPFSPDDDDTKPMQTAVPVIRNKKGEVYRASTQAILWIYSQSYPSPFRIYGPKPAYRMECYFDKELYPHAWRFFMCGMVRSAALTRRYIFGEVNPPSTRVWYRLAWWLLRPYLVRKYRLSDAGYAEARAKVREVFELVSSVIEGRKELLLGDAYEEGSEMTRDNRDPAKWKKDFLCENDFCIADITFASHAALVLLPSVEEGMGRRLGVSMPSVNELDGSFRADVEAFRATPAGKYAKRLYKKERGKTQRGTMVFSRNRPTPWWLNYHLLVATIALSLIDLLLLPLVALIGLVSPLLCFLLWLANASAVGYIAVTFVKPFLEGHKPLLRQLYALARGQPNPLAKPKETSGDGGTKDSDVKKTK